MRIRLELPGDGAAIRAVNDAAFGGPGEGRLVAALRASTPDDRFLSLVAEDDGDVIGHILFSPCRVGECELLALAPMAVLPAWQRSGIGSALVREGLALARERGFDAVIVLGHPAYYPRFGFAPASRYGITAPFEGVPDEAFLALELRPGALAGAAGTVRYPDAFSEV